MEIMECIAKCFNNILEMEELPKSWEKSKTKMIAKKKSPKVNDLRPITLMNTSYKIFMGPIKENLENSIRERQLQKDEQAGFTKGRRIEENLLIFRYCVESSYARGLPLYIIAIDFMKAFDSIKRHSIIQTLIKYKIDPQIINVIANIYLNDTSEVYLGDKKIMDINVTSGIKQGCKISPILFKLLTFCVIEDLNDEKNSFKSFNNNIVKICSLFFADDGLLICHSEEDATKLINKLIEITLPFGLEINKEKSRILIYITQKNNQKI
jgi:hypothetical protein